VTLGILVFGTRQDRRYPEGARFAHAAQRCCPDRGVRAVGDDAHRLASESISPGRSPCPWCPPGGQSDQTRGLSWELSPGTGRSLIAPGQRMFRGAPAGIEPAIRGLGRFGEPRGEKWFLTPRCLPCERRQQERPAGHSLPLDNEESPESRARRSVGQYAERREAHGLARARRDGRVAQCRKEAVYRRLPGQYA